MGILLRKLFLALCEMKKIFKIIQRAIILILVLVYPHCPIMRYAVNGHKYAYCAKVIRLLLTINRQQASHCTLSIAKYQQYQYNNYIVYDISASLIIRWVIHCNSTVFIFITLCKYSNYYLLYYF